MTCPERKKELKATLKSFAASDLEVKPKTFSLSKENKRQAQIENAYNVLTWADKQDCDYLMFCEDDIIINRYIVSNLKQWTPVKYEFCLVASLYDNLRPVPGTVRDNFRQLTPSNFGDSQCILIKKCFISFILSQWDKHHPAQLHGFRIFHSLFGVNQNLIFHNPSLVQHVGTVSSWGNGRFFSQVENFDREWRAESA